MGAVVQRSAKKSSDEQKDVEQIKPLVVVAIDFGTVHSGFVFSFKGYQEDIKSADFGGMLQKDRVPTILLLSPDKTFHSFGYMAQTNFHEILDYEKSKFYYFENFKMKIYDQNTIGRGMLIKDFSGKELEAMEVVSIAIKHLKDEALKIIHQIKLELKETDIQWMISITAISSDSARQFMREASMKAGILPTHLRLVLEPEAAALYSKPHVMLEEMPCGFKYVLADLGGGTSDICVHKTLDGGKLQEVYCATGETCGGSDVDKCFISMMVSLTGEEVWKEFSTNHTSAYISLVNEFRLKKKEFRPDTVALRLKIENALVYVIDKQLKKSLNDLINESEYTGKMEYESIEARLEINKDIVENMFIPSVGRIIKELNKVLDNCADRDVKTIVLVGGYSESLYLRERIQSAFSKMRVTFVDDARLAVLNGAVTMGWKPKNIIQRRSRYTYGFAVKYQFIEGVHPECLKVIEDGEVYCAHIFEKMIGKGQIVEYGQTFKHEVYSTARELSEKREMRSVSLYRSSLEDPYYCVEEEECIFVGQIVMEPPVEGWPDYWDGEHQLIVGETEFTVKCLNLDTGVEYKAQMDFL